MRIAYLGPAGTFTEDALREAAPEADFEPLRTATVHDAIVAVERGEAERALVPFENSIEGSVRSTLDTLAFEAERGDDRRRARLRGARPPDRPRAARAGADRRGPLPPPAARPVRALPARAAAGGERRSASSTAEAVRIVCESGEPWAAIGARAAAELYGGTILAEGIEDEATNVTRFVWIAPAGTEAAGDGTVEDLAGLLRARRGPPGRPGRRPARVLQSRGQPDPDRVAAAAPGPRAATCSSATSRARAEDPAVAEAIEALRGKAESVRILGSYPVRRQPAELPA